MIGRRMFLAGIGAVLAAPYAVRAAPMVPRPVHRAPLIWIRTRLPVAHWRIFYQGVPIRRIADGLTVEDWKRFNRRLLLDQRNHVGQED